MIRDMLTALGLLSLCTVIAAIGPAGLILAVAVLTYTQLRKPEDN